MQKAFVDQYRYLRDNLRPVMADLRPVGSKRDPRAGYERDCDAIADLHDFCAPSKGLRKRVLRVRPEVTPAEPVRDTRAPLPAPINFFNARIRELGLPVDTGIRAPSDRVVHERGTETPHGVELLAKRVEQARAEYERLGRYCDHSDDWKARRQRAKAHWDKAEADFVGRFQA